MAKAPFIDDSRLKHMFKVAGMSGESPERNVALLYVFYGTGMTLTEVATIPIRAYIKANGALIEKSEVAAEIAYNGMARPLWWSNPKVVDAIDKYLEYRLRHKHGITTRKAAFRGLDPESPIFLTGEGVPYKLMQRKTSADAISYSCDSLSQLVRKLHAQAGAEGGNAASARRTFAVRLHQHGYDLRHIHELMGHQTLTATKKLIDADPVRLGAIVRGVI